MSLGLQTSVPTIFRTLCPQMADSRFSCSVGIYHLSRSDNCWREYQQSLMRPQAFWAASPIVDTKNKISLTSCLFGECTETSSPKVWNNLAHPSAPRRKRQSTSLICLYASVVTGPSELYPQQRFLEYCPKTGFIEYTRMMYLYMGSWEEMPMKPME